MTSIEETIVAKSFTNRTAEHIMYNSHNNPKLESDYVQISEIIHRRDSILFDIELILSLIYYALCKRSLLNS